MSISIRLKGLLDENQIPYSVRQARCRGGRVSATSYRAGIQQSLPRLRTGRHAAFRALSTIWPCTSMSR